jgi:hypothetical protein
MPIKPLFCLQYANATLTKASWYYWLGCLLMFHVLPDMISDIPKAQLMAAWSPWRTSVVIAVLWLLLNRSAIVGNMVYPKAGEEEWTEEQITQPFGCSYSLFVPIIMAGAIALIVPHPVPPALHGTAWRMIAAFVVYTTVFEYFVMIRIRNRLIEAIQAEQRMLRDQMWYQQTPDDVE